MYDIFVYSTKYRNIFTDQLNHYFQEKWYTLNLAYNGNRVIPPHIKTPPIPLPLPGREYDCIPSLTFTIMKKKWIKISIFLGKDNCDK